MVTFVEVKHDSFNGGGDTEFFEFVVCNFDCASISFVNWLTERFGDGDEFEDICVLWLEAGTETERGTLENLGNWALEEPDVFETWFCGSGPLADLDFDGDSGDFADFGDFGKDFMG